MLGIGAQLKSAREGLGITVAQAAFRLRIRSMYVEAMEREAWSVVGEPVYARGFLRNYSRLLGLDQAELLGKLDQACPPASPQTSVSGYGELGYRASGAVAPRLSDSRWYPYIYWSMWSIAALLVVAVIINSIGLLLPPRAPTSYGPVATVPSNAVVAPQPAEPKAATQGTQLQETAGVRQQGGVVLRLQLTQASWLSVTVDGKRIVYQTLPAGTVREFRGSREITLRAGNAGGVVATIDGRALGTLGGPGEVQDRIFATSGARAQGQ